MSYNFWLTERPSIERFQQLWEGIRDVAANNFRVLPEDTRPVCQIMQQLPDSLWQCILTSFAVRQWYSSRSIIERQCDLQISAAVYWERCCDLPSGVRHPKFPIDEDYFHYTPTVFRRIDGVSGTSVCNTANGSHFRRYLKCSRGDFEPTVVLAANHDWQTWSSQSLGTSWYLHWTWSGQYHKGNHELASLFSGSDRSATVC